MQGRTALMSAAGPVGIAPSLNLDFTNVSKVDSRIAYSGGVNGTIYKSDGTLGYAPHNLMKSSEDFGSNFYPQVTGTGVISTNQFANPIDSAVTADRWTVTGGAMGRFANIVGLKTGSIYSFSIWVYLISASSSGLYIDVADGAGGNESGQLSVGEWVKVTTTRSAGSGGNVDFIDFITTADCDMYLFAVQLNNGSATLDYVKTTTAVVWTPRLDHGNVRTNLCLQSEDFGTTWFLQGTVPTITVNAGSAPDGSASADQVAFAADTYSRVTQIVTDNTSASTEYIFSVYVKAVSGVATFRLFAWDGGGGSKYSGNLTATSVWQRFDLTFTYGNGSSRQIALRSNSAGDSGTFLFWGAQLEQSSTVTKYIPTTTTSEFAVESLGVLIEEARTNLCLQSEDLGTTWAAINCSVTTNQAVGPDGGTNLDTITPSSGGNRLSSPYSGLSISAETQYTMSVYVRAGTSTYAGLIVGGSGGTPTNGGAIYSLSGAGTVISTKNDIDDSGIEHVGDGLYRIWMTITTGVSQTYAPFGVGSSDGSTYNYGIYPSATSTTIHAGFIVVEAGAFPTSYIKTTTASVTRTADVATMSDVSWFNATEGTILVRYDSNEIGGGKAGAFSIDSSNYNNAMYLTKGTDDVPDFWVYSGAALQAGVADQSGALVAGTQRAAAVVYMINDFAHVTDGGAVENDTSGSVPTGQTTLRLGDSFDSVADILNGHIARLTYWPVRLSNGILQTLTT